MNETTSIVAQVTANPVMVLTNEKAYSSFYESMAAEVEAHVPDLTSDKGRKEIAALAYKVTRTKTAIDGAGKALNEEARSRINVVDASRRKIREELEALAEKARKPLTEWETAETNRIDHIKRMLAHIEGVGRGYIGPDLQPFGLLIYELDEKIKVDVATFGEFLPEAQRAMAQAREKLAESWKRQQKEDADRAELEKLRADAAERERKDTEAKAAADAAAAEARAAAAAEAKKKADEEAAQRETERVQREANEKAEAMQAEAQRKVQEAEAAVRREAEEKAAREADREHRGTLMGEARVALEALAGMEHEATQKIVLAIVAGEIPHVQFQF